MILGGSARHPQDLLPKIDRVFALSAQKIASIERTWNPNDSYC